jgi:hypothetical protein
MTELTKEEKVFRNIEEIIGKNTAILKKQGYSNWGQVKALNYDELFDLYKTIEPLKNIEPKEDVKINIKQDDTHEIVEGMLGGAYTITRPIKPRNVNQISFKIRGVKLV